MKRRTGVTKGRRISEKKAGDRKVSRPRAPGAEPKRARDLAGEIARLYKPVKKPVPLRLDADVLDWLKKQGSGYQTRINRVLRGLMMEERKDSEE
jgi:uncharacterized protein (DUF4415 family)